MVDIDHAHGPRHLVEEIVLLVGAEGAAQPGDLLGPVHGDAVFVLCLEITGTVARFFNSFDNLGIHPIPAFRLPPVASGGPVERPGEAVGVGLRPAFGIVDICLLYTSRCV